VIIVGAGPAGLTAALYAGRSMLRTLVLEALGPGGELLKTEIIEDYPGFEHIKGEDLAEKFASHARKFGAEIRSLVTVTAVRKRADGLFDVETDDGGRFRAPTVIITAGGTPVRLGVPGEEEYAGKGVSYCAVCDGAFFKNQIVAVVGGGDAAVEESDFLTRYAEKVYLVHRRGELRASKILQQRLFANPKVEVIWDTVATDILGDPQGQVSALRLRNVKSGETKDLPVTGVFVFIGFRPNTGIVEAHVDHDEMGYLLTDMNMETSLGGLFAAGDVRAQLTRQVTTAAGDGTTAAIAAEKYLAARRVTPSGMEPEIIATGGYAV
jgi:thioredoxin reductase (NADPH)